MWLAPVVATQGQQQYSCKRADYGLVSDDYSTVGIPYSASSLRILSSHALIIYSLIMHHPNLAHPRLPLRRPRLALFPGLFLERKLPWRPRSRFLSIDAV